MNKAFTEYLQERCIFAIITTTCEIDKYLYINDPMHTSCKENSCFNEYWKISYEICQMLQETNDGTMSCKEVIQYQFKNFFGKEIDENILNDIQRIIRKNSIEQISRIT